MVLDEFIVHEQRVQLHFLELRFVLEVLQARPRHEKDQDVGVLDVRSLRQQL